MHVVLFKRIQKFVQLCTTLVNQPVHIQQHLETHTPRHRKQYFLFPFNTHVFYQPFNKIFLMGYSRILEVFFSNEISNGFRQQRFFNKSQTDGQLIKGKRLKFVVFKQSCICKYNQTGVLDREQTFCVRVLAMKINNQQTPRYAKNLTSLFQDNTA